jgi:broad specificity phosphatase PhoE
MERVIDSSGQQLRGRVLLVRHGETIAGPHMFLGARCDPPLNRRGRAQAWAIAHRLRSAPPVVVVSSRLRRARETAHILAGMRAVHVDRRLLPIDYGIISGLTVSAVERQFPEVLEAWRTNGTAPPGGGDSPDDLWRRSTLAALSALSRWPEARVLIVCHVGIIRAIVASARDVPRSDWLSLHVPHGTVIDVGTDVSTVRRWARDAGRGRISSAVP